MCAEPPVLLVCTTCRAGRPLPNDGVPPGAHLHAALAGAASPAVDVRPIQCLSACDQGCTATISMPGKWTYLLGRLEPGMARDVLSYATIYAGSATGAVLPSRRPASLGRAMLGRVPGLNQLAPA